jgi:hypothetical protein
MKLDWMDTVIGFVFGFVVHVMITKFISHVPEEVKVENIYVDTFYTDNLENLSKVLDSVKYIELEVIERNSLEKTHLKTMNERLDWEVEFLADAYNDMYLDYHDTVVVDTSAFEK